MIDIFGLVKEIFDPAAKLIDDLNTSDEERMKAKIQLNEIESKISLKVLDYNRELMDYQSKVIMAEANGQSWIQRNWRPITMLTFLVLVVFDSLDILPNRLASEAWTLLTIGIGGYVAGRSIEKLPDKVANAAKAIKNK